MHIPRIYIDTSVIGGCFDTEFEEWSNKLFDEFIAGKKIAVISDLEFDELKEAPEYIRNILDKIPADFINIVFRTEESQLLTSEYINNKALSPK